MTLGVQELATEKLTPLLQLRYQNSIADAIADLGSPEQISQAVTGFQKFLYAPEAENARSGVNPQPAISAGGTSAAAAGAPG